jgi:hypothetical protein
MRLLRPTGGFSIALIILSLSTSAHSNVIDSYFSMNFVEGTFGGNPLAPMEVNLVNITYEGGGGAMHTTAMPVFPGNIGGDRPRVGLPDYSGLVAAPTYTTLPILGGQPTGDGETTRTLGETVPINWDTDSGFPMIAISSVTIDSGPFPGLWELAFPVDAPYRVGLIPPGATNELDSLLFAPFGDIYDDLAGVAGNPARTAVVTAAPPGLEVAIGNATADFIFAAAAPVPMPGAIWLFGSGLLGMIGMARRKKAA